MEVSEETHPRDLNSYKFELLWGGRPSYLHMYLNFLNGKDSNTKSTNCHGIVCFLLNRISYTPKRNRTVIKETTETSSSALFCDIHLNIGKKILKITKGQSESAYLRRTDNTMAKRKRQQMSNFY